MRLFENSQETDYIEVGIEDDISDIERNSLWNKLKDSFLDREDDDGIVSTTIKDFKKYLDSTDDDVELYKIYLDGDIVYDKYALIYDTEVEY